MVRAAWNAGNPTGQGLAYSVNRILNVPNLLTLARIVMTPVIIYLILEGSIEMALVLMAVAALTDMLDGLIARYWNMRTTVGAYLDPVADKILLLGAIVTLFILEQVPLYLFLAIIFRDIVIVVGAIAYELLTHRLRMQPSMISKSTTLAQIVYTLLVLYSMVRPLDPSWLQSAAILTFFVTCASGLHYLVSWTIKALSDEREARG